MFSFLLAVAVQRHHVAGAIFATKRVPEWAARSILCPVTQFHANIFFTLSDPKAGLSL